MSYSVNGATTPGEIGDQDQRAIGDYWSIIQGIEDEPTQPTYTYTHTNMSATNNSRRIILITGANSGVGFATAKIIASSSPNYHVIVAARSAERGEAAVKELQSLIPKGSFSFQLLDVTEPESCQRAAQEVEQTFGHLDVLINNAGIMKNRENKDITKQSLLDTFTANMVGPVLVTQAFNPLLLKSSWQSGPYSIFVSSGLGSIGLASAGEHYTANYLGDSYRMSKAGLNMFVTQQHRIYRDQGLKVFSVCPGLVRSNLRGSEEAAISAGGRAISADTSGETMLAIIDGKRDSDAGLFLHKDGVYPW